MSSSSIDSYGYFYRISFNASNPTENLIASDDDGAGDRQFSIEVDLENNTNYVLVFSAYYAQITGSFTVIGSGIGTIHLPFTSLTMTSEF